jgi:predicted alpha/beta superfamily hydrolase
MHDGQNLFDPAFAYAGETWGVADALTAAVRAGRCREAIIVGIWNVGDGRWREYMPRRPLATPAGQLRLSLLVEQIRGIKQGQLPTSDDYLRFLVGELKPFVDHNFRTRPAAADTFIMGSSMGGLISLYALCEYPDVFGGAGCVSTHWPAAGGIVLDYLAEALPPPGRHKWYFDFGSETLDAQYAPYQAKADLILQAAGFTPGKDWITREFPGAAHNEPSWRRRVHIPLTFLLGGE